MAWREAFAKEGIGESTVESSVTTVRSSTSWVVNLIAVLVIGGEEGVATFEVVLRGGGGTRVEARLALGGVVLRSCLLEADTGEDLGVDRGAGVLDACFLEDLFAASRWIHDGIPARFGGALLGCS